MGDILIKNMEMPKEVNHPLYIRILSDGHIAKWDSLNGRFIETEATAQELPTHGRLIDADVFWKRLQKQTMILWGEKSKEYQYFLDVMDMIKSAPTIIEASKERE